MRISGRSRLVRRSVSWGIANLNHVTGMRGPGFTRPFTSKALSRVASFGSVALPLSERLDRILRDLNRTCVTYTLYDDAGRDLYEGMSCDPNAEIRKRLREDRFSATRSVAIRPTRNRTEALNEERGRIRTYCPIHNIQHTGSCPGR